MYYSKSTGGFYITEIHGDNIPADAVEITSKQHEALIAGEASGKRIAADHDGVPVLQDPPQPAHAELIEIILKQARAERAPILSVLDGLQVSALVGGDAVKAQQIETAKQGLRDITAIDLSPYSTYEEMRQAVKLEYAQLVGAAPDDVRLAFKQVAG